MDIKNPILKFTGRNDGKDKGGQNSKLAQGLQRAWNAIENFVTGEGSANQDLANQQKLIDYENKWQEKWWNKKNAYDSTEQQLNRWMAAGGNPNAFFGGQNVEGAASMSSGSGGSIGSVMGLPQGAAELAINGIKSYWDAKKTKAEAEGKEIENGTLKTLNESTINEILARTELLKKQGRLTDWQATQIEKLLPGLINKNTAEIEEIKERCNNLIAMTNEINARIKNLNEDTRIKILQRQQMEWEKTFRDDFGVDPKSEWGSMLIQAILNGKADEIFTQLFDQIENTTNSAVEILDDKLFDNFATPKQRKNFALTMSKYSSPYAYLIWLAEKKKRERQPGTGGKW